MPGSQVNGPLEAAPPNSALQLTSGVGRRAAPASLSRLQLNAGTLGGRKRGGSNILQLPCEAPRSMANDAKLCRATGSWAITVPATFEEVNNGDSWQAHADTRIVYVSSMNVTTGASRVSAASLRATVSRRLAPPSEVERHQFTESGVEGEAQISGIDGAFELKGFTCVDGCVATCVINFGQAQHRDWALATWRSLQPHAAGATPRPWWRFW